MKRIIVLALAIAFAITALSYSCMAGSNKPGDMDSYFNFPRATIIMESGKTKSVVECSANHTFPIPPGPNPEPYFGSGMVFANETGIEAYWEFVRKTDYGDVYLIIVDRPNKPEAVTPVLFAGKAQTIISTNDLTIQMLPARPDK